MTEAEVIQIVREHFESRFPKVCPNSNRRFATLREYILLTKRLGPPMSYDSDLSDWKTTQPIGSVVQANCPCGSTLALTTDGIPIARRLLLLDWVRIETERRGLNPSQLLDHLRDEIRTRVLAEPNEGDPRKEIG